MVKIYIIRESDYEQVDQPVFSTGDTYIVDAGDRIWIWLGEKTTVDEKFAGAFISDLLDKERRGAPDVETVEQDSRQRPRQIHPQKNREGNTSSGYV